MAHIKVYGNNELDIIETNLQPKDGRSLDKRYSTDMIVIHHTGSRVDTDQGAVQIDNYHKNSNDWAMIGYHLVVRKNGDVERGRPEWAVGAHASGENSHTIGIHLSGDFNAAEPTNLQIEHTAMLIAYLTEKYDIPCDRDHIIGHDECYVGVGHTDGSGCPGRNLQSKLDLISGKANFYRYGPPNNNVPAEVKPDAVVKTVIEIRSDAPISEETIKKISDIFHESLCPNESMLHSIPNFRFFNNNGVIVIGNSDITPYSTRIEF